MSPKNTAPASVMRFKTLYKNSAVCRPGRKPWYKSALLLDVFGNLFGIKDYRGVEICESDHKQEVHDSVIGLVLEKVIDIGCGCGKPSSLCVREEVGQKPWEKQDRDGKDNRDDSGLVYAQRQMSVDPAVKFVAAHALGIRHRDISLGFGHKHDCSQNKHRDCRIDYGSNQSLRCQLAG
jgi:hypothetical protein